MFLSKQKPPKKRRRRMNTFECVGLIVDEINKDDKLLETMSEMTLKDDEYEKEDFVINV